MITKSGYGTNRTNNVSSEKTQRYKKLLEEPQVQPVVSSDAPYNFTPEDAINLKNTLNSRLKRINDKGLSEERIQEIKETSPILNPEKYHKDVDAGYYGRKAAEGFTRAGEGIVDATKILNEHIQYPGLKYGEFVTSLGGLAKNPVSDLFTKRLESNKESAMKAVQETPTDNYAKMTEFTYNNVGTGHKLAGDVVSGVTAMAPTIAANFIVPGSGYAVLGGQAFGSGTQQAYQHTGELGAKEEIYGLLSGLSEVAVEKISGGIGGLGNGMVDDIASKMIRNGFIRSATGEGIEEAVTTFIDPYLQRLTYNKEAEGGITSAETWKEAVRSALIGALTSMVLQGGSATVNTTTKPINKIIEKREINRDIENMRSLYKTQQAIETYKKLSPYSKYQLQETDTNISTKNIKPRKALPEGGKIYVDPQGVAVDSRNYVAPRTDNIQTENYSPVNARQVLQGETLPRATQVKQTTDTELKLPTTKTNSVYQAAKGNVDVKIANRLMDIAEKTNVRVEGFYDENPNIEGSYKDGVIRINVNSNKAADTIFAHEFTHHLESTNAWEDVRDAIINSNTLYNMLSEKGINIDEYKQQIKDAYAKIKTKENPNGIILDDVGVEKEIVAKFVENNLMKDEKTIVRMINENPSFMQRLKNFWDDLVVRFKGTAEEKELRKIQNIYNKAFAEAQNTINNTNNIKYSILDKDAWEGRQRYIDKRNASNRENAINATEEQLETIEKIARIRHDIHISDALFNSESSSNQEQSDFLMNINDELEELELPTIDLPISWDLSDLTTDVDVYELGVDYDEAYSEFQSQKEQINNAIEKYLREFDKSHNTNYAPTGMTRYGKEAQKGSTQTTETKYSISEQTNTDNQGRKLSQQQQEFFKDNKVRDEDGNLQVAYHGTGFGFTVFDKEKAGSNYGNWGMYGKGFYFTTNKEQAKRWAESSRGDLSEVKEVYLNITNPFDPDADYTEMFADLNLDPFLTKKGYRMLEYLQEQGKDTRSILQAKGFDGIYSKYNKDNIVVFESNQIKNVDNTNPTENADIRYSIETDKQTSAPKRYLSEHANTLLESGITLPETRDVIAKMIEQGTLTHERITDKDAQAYAEKYIIENGFEDAVQHWNHLIKSNREMSKEELALGQMIYNNAQQARDVNLVKKMIADLVAEGTTAGRNLQAMSMVKKLTPDGRLYALERSVQKLNQQYRDEIGKKFKDIEIPNDLAEALLKSKDQKEIDANVEKIQQYIADQIPATWKDKLNAWRYLAMLGNTRTHIRNLAGNAVFIPAIEIKNAMALVGEKTLPTAERTKAILTKKDRTLLDFAENDFNNNEPIIRGENKFDIASGVQEKRRIFDNKLLETLRQANFAALEKEDTIFLKYHYKRAMARAIKAKGLSLEQLKSGSAEMNSKLSEIRNYAINEAQKATYRDFNALAKWISNTKSRLKRGAAQNKGYTKLGYEAGYALAEGFIPFTKTPANIVKRIGEYSPLGIAKGILDMNTKVKSNDMPASQAIDELCSGLTGTGIVGLGILLASLGFITGGGEDKQKEEQFESLKGNQNYALKIGNKTYTIDWAAPTAVPLFVGVEIFNSLKNSENADVMGSFVKIVDPVFEMSMLQGINSALSAYGSDNAIGKAVSNMFQSYLGQYVPSLFGAIARTVDPVRRTTYADKNKMLPTGIQTFTQKQLQKIPAVSMKLPTYKDQFGRDSRTDNLLIRIFSNFLSPGYLAEVKDQPVENELTRIYDKTGETDVLPSYASKYITVDGEKINFTYEQYEKFATTRGDIAYKNLEKLFADARYKRLSDEDKVSAIRKIYTYANEVAKSKVSDYKLTKEKARIERQGNNYYREVLK